MKKVLVSLLVAAFVVGTAAYSFASELDFYGYYRAAFSYVDNNDGTTAFEKNDKDEFYAYQRVRQYFEYVTNENLKAVVGYEIDSGWGYPNQRYNGSFSADQPGNIEIKRAMVEFNWPNTDFNIRAGTQGFSLPGGAMGSPLLAGDMTGLIMSTPINDMLGLSFGWVRGYDFDDAFGGGDSEDDGDLDAFFVSVPVTMEGFSVNPYFVYSNIEQDAMGQQGFLAGDETRMQSYVAGLGDTTYTDDSTAWWLGTDFSLNMMDPLIIKGSFIYGTVDSEAEGTIEVGDETIAFGDDDVADRSGFYGDLMIDYVMDNMTPSLFFLYSSGDDDDLGDGSETFPALHSDGFVAPPVASAIGFTGCQTSLSLARNYSFAQYVPQGVWKLGFALKNLSFIDKLSHTIGVAYSQGTHDKEVGEALAATPNYGAGWLSMELTKEDSAFEFGFNNVYKLYEALSLTLDYEYAKLDMDEDVWGKDFRDEDAQHLTLGVCYSF
jgi:hypothetical protein